MCAVGFMIQSVFSHEVDLSTFAPWVGLLPSRVQELCQENESLQTKKETLNRSKCLWTLLVLRSCVV